jgi:hypothetical protein
MALLCRVLFCGALEWGALPLGQPAFNFPDEYFYYDVTTSYAATPVKELARSEELKESQPRRVCGFMSLYVRKLGQEVVWGRLVGAMVGAIVASLIALACQAINSQRALPWCALIACCGPQLIMVSSVWLKEVWCLLGAAMCLYGMSRITNSSKVVVGVVACLLGCVILCFFRLQLGLVLLVACCFCLVARRRSSFESIVLGLLLASGVTVGILQFQGGSLSEEAQMHLESYSVGEWSESTLFTSANQMGGARRLVHVPILFFNPPPKNLYKLVILKSTWILRVIRETITVQWWGIAPWVALGILSLKREARWGVPIIMPYLACWIIAAVMRNGVNPEAARYRDSLMPFAIVLVGFGIDKCLADKSGNARLFVRWVYVAAIVLGIALALRDFGLVDPGMNE